MSLGLSWDDAVTLRRLANVTQEGLLHIARRNIINKRRQEEVSPTRGFTACWRTLFCIACLLRNKRVKVQYAGLVPWLHGTNGRKPEPSGLGTGPEQYCSRVGVLMAGRRAGLLLRWQMNYTQAMRLAQPRSLYTALMAAVSGG